MTSSSTTDDGGDDEDWDLVPLALLIEAFAGSLLAFSMTVQRYALSSPATDGMVPLLCCRLGRLKAWFLGLLIYAAASGLKVLGFNLGPFTICASVFVGTLLCTNLVFGRWLLREELTVPKVLGAFLVLAGACVCIGGTPTGVPTSFTVEEMEDLLYADPPQGGFYLSLVVALVLASIVFIAVTDWMYPVKPDAAPSTESEPSALLAQLMILIYPGSLGMDESIADLCNRGYSAMFVQCGVDGTSCVHWTLITLMVLGSIAAVASALWLKVVFQRYETTLALPIEYGSLNLFSVIGGLLFYQEGSYMESWQLALVLSGAGVMMLGIAVGLQDCSSCGRGSRSRSRSPLPPSPPADTVGSKMLPAEGGVRVTASVRVWPSSSFDAAAPPPLIM